MYDLPHFEASLSLTRAKGKNGAAGQTADPSRMKREWKESRRRTVLNRDSPCVVTNMRDVRRGECGQRDERACAASQVQSSVAQECTSGVEPAERNWRGNVLVSVSWDRLSTRLRDALLAWRRGAHGGGEDSPNEYIRRTSRSPKEPTDRPTAHILSTFRSMTRSFDPKEKNLPFLSSDWFFSFIHMHAYTLLCFMLLCIFTWICPRQTERSIDYLSLGRVSWWRYICARKKSHEARTGYPVRWTRRASTGNVTRSRGCFSGLRARNPMNFTFDRLCLNLREP